MARARSAAMRMVCAGLAVGLIAGLGGCVGLVVQQVRGLPATGSDFTRNLYDQYLQLAEVEYKDGDYENSDAFGIKARAAAAGEAVLPAEVGTLSAGTEDLAIARRRLMTVLDGGARSRASMDAAQAQAKFECWLEEQRENTQPADIVECRDAFQALLSKLEMPQTAIADVPAERATVAAEPFLVFFPFNSATITRDGQSVINAAVTAAKVGPVINLAVRGHADAVGGRGYNLKLSWSRARAVAVALIRAGIPAETIGIEEFGQTRPLVQSTGREAKNRRVEIVLQK